MQYGQTRHTPQFSWKPAVRVSGLLLAGLLGWGEVGYGGGPTFTSQVEVQNLLPLFQLTDTDIDEANWLIQADAEASEAFSVKWADEGRSAAPLVIENGAPDNAVYVDDTGQLGLGTASPRSALEIRATSPLITFEDSHTPQTWQLAANAIGGFLVLDETDNNIPFLIDPGVGTNALWIKAGGNVGMGTQVPSEAVDVVRDGPGRFQLTSFSDTGSDAAQFIQRRARGTRFLSQAAQQGDNLGLFSFRGMKPNSRFSGSRATITAQTTQDWSNSAHGTRLLFGTTPNDTDTVQTVMEITHDGRVLINGSQLSVPDYVFGDDYKLMPLEELQAYIAEHKHLPEVASEAEVRQAGVDLGGAQMALLKKIEELTLYTLQQHEQLTAVVERLAALEQQLTETVP